MELQHGSGDVRGDRPAAGFVKDLRLALAVGDQEDLFGLHDALDAHGVSLFRHVVDGLEEPGVGLDGLGVQIHAVGAFFELVSRLVEADVSGQADAQQLDVHAAHGIHHGVIPGALFRSVRLGAVGDVGVGGIDIDVLEEVLPHEVSVALVVILGQAHVLVQVHGSDLGEVQIPGFIAFDQLGVQPQRGGTGSQTQNTFGF